MWPLVEADFQSHYGIDLDEQRHRPYRWFRVRLFGLLAHDDTRVWRHFRAQQDDADPTPDTPPDGPDSE